MAKRRTDTGDVAQTMEVVTSAPAEIELQSISTADLRVQLGDAIGLTEAAIVKVAAIWAELTRRGEDLSDVRFSLSRFMLPVAEGRLLPRLAVVMSGQTRALERLVDLPVNEQAALMEGREIELFKGGEKVERKPLLDLTYSEIALAVRDGHILTPKEQRLAYERSARLRNPSQPRRGRPPRITVLPDNTVRIGAVEVPAERLLAELRAAGLI